MLSMCSLSFANCVGCATMFPFCTLEGGIRMSASLSEESSESCVRFSPRFLNPPSSPNRRFELVKCEVSFRSSAKYHDDC